MSNTENIEQFKVGDRIKCVKERLGFPVGFETTVLEDEFCRDADGDLRPVFEDYFRLVTPTPTRTALEQRMEDLVRRIASVRDGCDGAVYSFREGVAAEWEAEAVAIVAELPDPVDPDLIEARKISVGFKSGLKIEDEILAGKRDDEEAIQAILKAIQRGRALERGE